MSYLLRRLVGRAIELVLWRTLFRPVAGLLALLLAGSVGAALLGGNSRDGLRTVLAGGRALERLVAATDPARGERRPPAPLTGAGAGACDAPEGDARKPSTRALNILKNRTAVPTSRDVDPEVTLARLLARGPDRERWSASAAAELVGYVVDVYPGGVETAHCHAQDLAHRDTHIELALGGVEVPRTRRVVVEVTPHTRALVGLGDTAALKRRLLGEKVRIRGWLLFDDEHELEAENTNPGNPANWRATAWELNPVTAVSVER